MTISQRKPVRETLGILQIQQKIIDTMIDEERRYMDVLPQSKVNTVEYMEVEDAIAVLEFAKNALNDYLIYLESTTKRR
ncbi:hypothetical protein ACY2F7_002404 [Listeria monocytogenes]|nr:hypothetical protein [Listeria monocytogenes]HAO5929461.1 hypothetical protein [Listeria monocytogenes]HAO5992594.1 hypothetical protein [Listeria monocytogenes]HAO6205669.1 hypothetical protein [Listeria monocytogenes]HAO6486485.1 hypothetical protein [Listeria monocytogenes]